MLKHGVIIIVAVLTLAVASFGCSLVPDGNHSSRGIIMQSTSR